MLYAGMFCKFPNIKLIVAYCGAALPALSVRHIALGTETWVPNPNHLTKEEMKQQLRALYLDTAATNSALSLAPALTMATWDHVVYGTESGVPCSTEETLEAN
jgi:predicted TIM-barrel fold metal-dependent hydrolase